MATSLPPDPETHDIHGRKLDHSYPVRHPEAVEVQLARQEQNLLARAATIRELKHALCEAAWRLEHHGDDGWSKYLAIAESAVGGGDS